MTYTPNIFSTKGGLTRTIVHDWVRNDDLSTIDEWLKKGEPHARLAAEAIECAVSLGKTDIAERVWDAGWHKPADIFYRIWSTLERSCYWLKRDASVTKLSPAENERLIEWAVKKCSSGTLDKAAARDENIGRVLGLRLAFNDDREAMWSRLLSFNTDASIAEAHDLFLDISRKLPCFPKEHTTTRMAAPAWAETHALSDLVDHGFRPGGSIWVGAAKHDDLRPFLDKLISKASSLTTPRQRTAILIYAAQEQCSSLDILLDAFSPLGVLDTIKLTPSESKRANPEAAFLVDIRNDNYFAASRVLFNDRALCKPDPSLSAALGPMRWSAVKRSLLADVAAKSSPPVRLATKPRSM